MPVLAALVMTFLLSVGCKTPDFTALNHANLTSTWVSVDSLNEGLPSDVRVYSYSQADPPLRAWFTSIRPGPHSLPIVVTAGDSTSRSTTAEIGDENDACLAVNGGYFDLDSEPTRHVGLLWLADTLHSAATRPSSPRGASLPARAALGIMSDGRADVDWAGDSAGVLVRYAYDEVSPWAASSALGAGPMLLRNGEYSVTATEEGFAPTSIPGTHPRTAAGISADGRLILMVVDGRQESSRGVNLAELADLMRSAGAVNALNLDGGGSSTLIINGRLINRPTGGLYQRRVMSAVIVRCD